MSKNQLHGKQFESYILTALGLNEDSLATSTFDIPLGVAACRAKQAGSIKVANGKLAPGSMTLFKGNVGLADASRVWNWKTLINALSHSYDELLDLDPSIRLIIGVYEQNENLKKFTHILDTELILKELTERILYGEISLGEVRALHEGLSVDFFPKGQHELAREWAHSYKNKLHEKAGIIKLNPKIDSGTQRRLQCSMELSDLLLNVEKMGRLVIHTDSFYELKLPFEIESSQRERLRK